MRQVIAGAVRPGDGDHSVAHTGQRMEGEHGNCLQCRTGERAGAGAGERAGRPRGSSSSSSHRRRERRWEEFATMTKF